MSFIDSIIMGVRCFVKSQMASCCDPKRSHPEGGPVCGLLEAFEAVTGVRRAAAADEFLAICR